MKNIDEKIIEKAYSYKEYNEYVAELFEEGKVTNGDNTEANLDYTKLNMHRSARWDKRAKIDSELAVLVAKLEQPMIWLVLSEGWCGDAAQQLPFFQKLAELNENLELKILLRDEHPELMDQFLTNGARSIPKVIFIEKETGNVEAEWGPRPHIIQEEYLAKRRNPDYENKKATEDLHLWYARNKGEELQKELKQIIKELNN